MQMRVDSFPHSGSEPWQRRQPGDGHVLSARRPLVRAIRGLATADLSRWRSRGTSGERHPDPRVEQIDATVRGGIGGLRRGPEPATVAFDFESRSRKPPPAFGGRGHSLNDVRGAHLLVDEYQDLSRAEQGLIGLCSGATSLAIHLLGAAGRDESAPAVAGPGQRQPATASGHSCRARDLERDQHLDQPRWAELGYTDAVLVWDLCILENFLPPR